MNCWASLTETIYAGIYVRIQPTPPRNDHRKPGEAPRVLSAAPFLEAALPATSEDPQKRTLSPTQGKPSLQALQLQGAHSARSTCGTASFNDAAS